LVSGVRFQHVQNDDPVIQFASPYRDLGLFLGRNLDCIEHAEEGKQKEENNCLIHSAPLGPKPNWPALFPLSTYLRVWQIRVCDTRHGLQGDCGWLWSTS
jgi:hypothetical protein